jgi:ATP-dependent Clp protease protease subunit
MNVTQLDIFSRLMKDRILWVSGVVDENMASIVQAQLMYFNSVDSNKDVKMYINSPGGSVLHGLGIVDVMRYINCDVSTTNVGMAASMGSILLSSGTKGKRYSLNSSRVLIHQVSSGTEGNIQDNRISQMESEKHNYLLFRMLSENCDRPFQEILEKARRDYWMSAQEALDFGVIDDIITTQNDDKKVSTVAELMQGFDEYYDKEILKK